MSGSRIVDDCRFSGVQLFLSFVSRNSGTWNTYIHTRRTHGVEVDEYSHAIALSAPVKTHSVITTAKWFLGFNLEPRPFHRLGKGGRRKEKEEEGNNRNEEFGGDTGPKQFSCAG